MQIAALVDRLMAIRTDRRRKNLYIDQVKLDRAKRLLGVDTETDAIDQALDLVDDYAVFKAEVLAGIRALAGTGGIDDLERDED